jgi:hypothetical protein
LLISLGVGDIFTDLYESVEGDRYGGEAHLLPSSDAVHRLANVDRLLRRLRKLEELMTFLQQGLEVFWLEAMTGHVKETCRCKRMG